jgi:hypothetical protein
MKRLVHLLIILLLSVQVDDAWVDALAVPSAPLVGDSDEYLPIEPRVREDRFFATRTALFASIKPRSWDAWHAQSGLSSECLTATFSSSPLYRYMSLQI